MISISELFKIWQLEVIAILHKVFKTIIPNLMAILKIFKFIILHLLIPIHKAFNNCVTKINII